jgi:hypothetical protein
MSSDYVSYLEVFFPVRAGVKRREAISNTVCWAAGWPGVQDTPLGENRHVGCYDATLSDSLSHRESPPQPCAASYKAYQYLLQLCHTLVSPKKGLAVAVADHASNPHFAPYIAVSDVGFFSQQWIPYTLVNPRPTTPDPNVLPPGQIPRATHCATARYLSGYTLGQVAQRYLTYFISTQTNLTQLKLS